MTTEVVTTKKPTLENLRAQLAAVAVRKDRLRLDLEQAQAAAAQTAAAVRETEAGLASGVVGADEVVNAAGKAEAAVRRVAHLRTAHDTVTLEHEAIGNRVLATERESERAKQEQESEPLRREAATCATRFIDALLNVGAPLRRRQEIAEKIRRDFPVASPVAALNVDDLVRDLGQKAGVTTLSYHEVSTYILRVIGGPTGQDARPDVLRDRFYINTR